MQRANRNTVDTDPSKSIYLLLSDQRIIESGQITKEISTEELEYQLTAAKADVAELQAAGQTTSAAAYFTIQITLERFLGLIP